MIMKCCSYTSCCWWTVSGCSISFWILFRSSLCRFSSGRRVRCPYKKPNDSLLYINTSSNHPPQILKQIPTSIAERLSNNSSNETVLNLSKVCYEEALKQSGYSNTKLKYSEQTPPKEKRNRLRNVIWFNPPFSKNVSTNVAKKFLSLINKHFSKSPHLKK